MAFLTDLDKKLSMLGQGALSKTKEVTDSAKMSAQIRSLDAQKKEALEELGKTYYALYIQDSQKLTDAGRNIAAGIQQLDMQKQKIIEELQRLRGTMFCPNCNTEIPANSKFCNVCGSKIDIPSPQTVQPPVSGKTCRVCGALLEDDQMFCVNCGTKVESVASSSIENAEMPAVDKTEPDEYKCPNCGAVLKPGQKFCTSCGTKIN